ncbi:MAG: hypothetical protein P9L97_11350 [Candidatus Tenebribacter davisii]|nr:hypothetical protein [Candidatus Tenebribacter davisii]
MRYIFISLSLIILFSISCDTTSSEELNKIEITDILDLIQISFNMNDIDGIMQSYHQYFFHNGDDFDFERTRWEIRLNDNDDLLFEDIEITLNGNFATASFIMRLDETSTDEPSDENGDISYFYHDFESWKICGKDFVTEP